MTAFCSQGHDLVQDPGATKADGKHKKFLAGNIFKAVVSLAGFPLIFS